MTGARPCAYVDPVFISQSYDISISICTRNTNLSVFLVLMLKLMSTQFSLASTCACAYAYAYTLDHVTVKLFVAVTFKSVNKTLWCYHSNESSLVGLLHSAVPEGEGLMAVNKSMSDVPRRPGHSGLASVIEFLSHPNFVVNDILDSRNSL